MKAKAFVPEGTHHPICEQAYDTAHKQGHSWRCECELIRAACAFQRERDAELVEHHVNGPGPLRTQLATAIREGG